jgi:hypothetical protein
MYTTQPAYQPQALTPVVVPSLVTIPLSCEGKVCQHSITWHLHPYTPPVCGLIPPKAGGLQVQLHSSKHKQRKGIREEAWLRPQTVWGCRPAGQSNHFGMLSCKVRGFTAHALQSSAAVDFKLRTVRQKASQVERAMQERQSQGRQWPHAPVDELVSTTRQVHIISQ